MAFDFNQFEKEAAKLLADMRASAERAAAYERELKGGRVSQADLESRVGGGRTGGSQLEGEIRARGLATDQLAARQRALTAAEQESINAERTMAQVMAQNSAATARSGALTNEFVDAAKRGEVTVRELGNEVVGTIAKFGGWIVAGSAVYFAFNALTAVKKGAIDASSGVNELQRVVNNVNSGEAQEGFRRLAEEFNVPITTAADAVYEMGKVFNNQNDAFEAAKQVLYAVKIGELDTAAASRYLISIINGFHLPASQMAKVLDQVNQAQNNFGVGTEDVLSGVAKAAGTFHQASGPLKKYGEDYNYLLALITTGVKVTGQTGATIGTAIARSPNFLRRPSNQEILRQFGIDPNGPIETVYNEAFKKVKDLSGKQVQELAAGLAGPQYGARVFTGILSNYDEFQKVLKDTSPAKSQGSAQRELQRQLGGVDEQIGRLGVSLERLGAELAKSHFFDSLGLGLQTLNSMLDVVNALAEDFGKLPEPAQQLLAYLIQVSLLMKTLRRLNLGESIAGGPGAQPGAARGGLAALFGYNSPQAFARQTRKAFINEAEALEKERARLGGQLYRGQRKESLAFGGASAANQELQAAVGQYGPLSPEAQAAQQKANAAAAEATAARQRNLSLAYDEQAATERLAAVQNSIAATRGRVLGGLNTEATIAEAERLGYPVPAGFTKGSTARPIRLGMEPTPSQLKELETLKALQERGLVPPAVESEAGAVAGVTGATAGRVTALSTKLGGVRGALGSLGGAFGNLLSKAGTLAFGAFTISFIADELVQIAESVGDEFEQAGRSVDSSKARLDRLRSARQGAKAGSNFKERLTDVFTEQADIGPISVPTLGLGSTFGLNTGPSTTQLRQEVEGQEQHNIEAIIALQKKQRAKGQYVPFRYIPEIVHDIERVKKSGKSRAEINDALDKYEKELQTSADSPHHNAELKHAQQLLQQSQADSASNKSLVEKLQVLTSEQITQRLDAALALVGGSTGAAYDPNYAKKAALIYQAVVQKIGKSTDSESLKELAQARQSYFEGIEQGIQGELQYQLDLAQSPADRRRAYAGAFARFQQFSRSSGVEAKKQEQLVRQLKDRRSRLLAQEENVTPQEEHTGAAEDVTKKVKELDKQIGLETEKLKELKDSETQKARFIRDIVAKLRQQQFEANEAYRQAQEGAREALTADPILQAQEKIKYLGNEIDQAIKVYGRESQQVLQLITEQRQARQQLVQNQLSIIQSRGGLESAGILEQVPKEKAALYGANGLLAQLRYAQAHRNQFDPKTIIDLEAQVKEAQAQLAFDVVQEATQLADARYGIREARAQYASDPVLAAKLAVEKAKYDVEHAQTPLEKLNAQQTYIQALGSKRDAVAQARLESITFEANIQKITSQEEIEQLENLLRTYKLSLTMRRQIREQIHSLKSQLSSEGEAFNLNVGDFALPTAYDIRRAVLGGSGRQVSVTQTNHFNIENHSNDPSVVGKAIGHALGGAAESAARSAGVGA